MVMEVKLQLLSLLWRDFIDGALVLQLASVHVGLVLLVLVYETDEGEKMDANVG